MKVELSPEAKILIDRYFNIKVGEWSFACPYFMNERGLRNLPIAYSGKGLPEEIEGDMIKRGRNHVMLVEWVDARQFGYIHADTMPEWGLQRGAVEVIDAKLPLEKQGWSVKEDLGLYKKAGDKGLVRLR